MWERDFEALLAPHSSRSKLRPSGRGSGGVACFPQGGLRGLCDLLSIAVHQLSHVIESPFLRRSLIPSPARKLSLALKRTSTSESGQGLKQNYLFCQARPKGAGSAPLLKGIFFLRILLRSSQELRAKITLKAKGHVYLKF